MSSFCYWEPHPLRRLDASGTEIIFMVNNLLEKLTLNILVQETNTPWLLGMILQGSTEGQVFPTALPKESCSLGCKNPAIPEGKMH